MSAASWPTEPFRAAAAPTLIGSAAGLQTGAKVDGNDNAWGWNVGVLWQATESTRIGAAYRSYIKYTVNGTVDFSNPTAQNLGPLPPTLAPVGALLVNGVNAQLANGNVSLQLKVPETANISIFSTLNDRWDVMADLQYTGWSSVQQLQVVRSTGAVLETLPENFRNTWRGSVGANYRYDNSWTLRGGVAYDQSPVNNTDRIAATAGQQSHVAGARGAVQVLAGVGARFRLCLHLGGQCVDQQQRRQHGRKWPHQRLLQGQRQYRRAAADIHRPVDSANQQVRSRAAGWSCGALFS